VTPERCQRSERVHLLGRWVRERGTEPPARYSRVLPFIMLLFLFQSL
jgi:hypothetical protein